MEPKGSLPCSQQPATCAYPESDESIHNFPLYFTNIRPNIILPSATLSPKLFLPFRFSD